MKKRKSLGKKIERLKARLEKNTKKLAKLTMKLGAAVAGSGSKKSAKPAATAKNKKRASAGPAALKPTAPIQKPTPKAKKKLNLTPERRAQLAAAMKARWAAKKAATKPQSNANTGGGNLPA